MPMYNLIEYSDKYSDTSGSLWHFKRDVSNDNAPSFKYKANLIGNTENNGTKNGVKIAVPLKCLSNFWRSLEMQLTNCKVELSLKWHERCLLTAATTATFTITDAKLYLPIVILSIEDNSKLSIYNIGYVTIKKIGDFYDVNSANPLYLRIDNASGYVKEDGTHKYLIFDSTDKNKELLKRYDDAFN